MSASSETIAVGNLYKQSLNKHT